jgi:hypothetical protein
MIFSLGVLYYIAYFFFGFEIQFSDIVQNIIGVTGVTLFFITPVIILINIFFCRKNKHGKLLGFIYLFFWLCILTRLFITIC